MLLAGPAAAKPKPPARGGATVTEIELPERDLFPGSIVEGPDGNMWFALYRADPGHKAGTEAHRDVVIARMTSSGELTEFPVPHGLGAHSLVSGPEGDVWFLGEGALGRITMGGQVTTYPVAADGESHLAVGPDGNLWLTRRQDLSADAITRVTPSGAVAEFLLPRESGVHGISAGPDGNLWFTEVFAE